MYENNPDVSMNQVSKDLGINRGTLRYWIDQFGTGKKTTPVAVEKPDVDPTVVKEIRRLRKENARLREERDILVKAAKYFAALTKISRSSRSLAFSFLNLRISFTTVGSTSGFSTATGVVFLPVPNWSIQ